MKIKFIPQNIEVDVDPSKNILEVARENDISIQSSCNGLCNCGDCRIFLREGEVNVLPPTPKEMKLIGQGHYTDQRRLACQLHCFGPVTVDLSEQQERAKQGKISAQFLERTQKKSVGEARSKSDILIEDDEEMKQLKKTFNSKTYKPTHHKPSNKPYKKPHKRKYKNKP